MEERSAESREIRLKEERTTEEWDTKRKDVQIKMDLANTWNPKVDLTKGTRFELRIDRGSETGAAGRIVELWERIYETREAGGFTTEQGVKVKEKHRSDMKIKSEVQERKNRLMEAVWFVVSLLRKLKQTFRNASVTNISHFRPQNQHICPVTFGICDVEVLLRYTWLRTVIQSQVMYIFVGKAQNHKRFYWCCSNL